MSHLCLLTITNPYRIPLTTMLFPLGTLRTTITIFRFEVFHVVEGSKQSLNALEQEGSVWNFEVLMEPCVSLVLVLFSTKLQLVVSVCSSN